MTRSVQIQRMERRFLTSAVALVRASFDAALLPYMVYGQVGISRFLEVFLPRAGVANARLAWVAIDAGEVVGYAEFDVRERRAAHLSYICVADSHRGQGVAGRLIGRFAEDYPCFIEMTLDVFESNTGALSLYRRLGLYQVGDVTQWAVRSLPAASEEVIAIEDLPQSLASHAMYGFSTLSVLHRGRTVALGRLGDRSLRVSSVTEFFDEELLAAARNAFPASCDALVMAPSGLLSDRDSKAFMPLTRSIRMQGRLS